MSCEYVLHVQSRGLNNFMQCIKIFCVCECYSYKYKGKTFDFNIVDMHSYANVPKFVISRILFYAFLKEVSYAYKLRLHSKSKQNALKLIL